MTKVAVCVRVEAHEFISQNAVGKSPPRGVPELLLILNPKRINNFPRSDPERDTMVHILWSIIGFLSFPAFPAMSAAPGYAEE
jgi:hypothetical protein